MSEVVTTEPRRGARAPRSRTRSSAVGARSARAGAPDRSQRLKRPRRLLDLGSALDASIRGGHTRCIGYRAKRGDGAFHTPPAAKYPARPARCCRYFADPRTRPISVGDARAAARGARARGARCARGARRPRRVARTLRNPARSRDPRRDARARRVGDAGAHPRPQRRARAPDPPSRRGGRDRRVPPAAACYPQGPSSRYPQISKSKRNIISIGTTKTAAIRSVGPRIALTS
jgi:hypothetical protein